jgi:hypothetical protein
VMSTNHDPIAHARSHDVLLSESDSIVGPGVRRRVGPKVTVDRGLRVRVAARACRPDHVVRSGASGDPGE